MGLYVRPEYLETIHYYYFSIGLFSLICAIVFGFSFVYSFAFSLLYIGQSSFAWYISWYMRKRMREFVIPESFGFAARHIFLTFFVGGLAFGLWFLGSPHEELLISVMLYANYFVFFVALAWYLSLRFGVVKTIFDVYDSRVMGVAKKLIIKTRHGKRDFFSRTLVSSEIIKNYTIGSDREIDDMLMNAWRERKSQKLLKTITEIEIALSSRLIDRLKGWVGQISARGVITPRDRDIITKYEQILEEYAQASLDYEREVVSKLPSE